MHKLVRIGNRVEYHWIKGFNEQMQDLEIYLITMALVEANYNKALAARIMGIERTCLVEKMKKLGIDCDRWEAKIRID